MTQLQPSTWEALLHPEYDKPYFKTLMAFLQQEAKAHNVCPRKSQIMAAFRHTPFDAVKVVILGQDPYHGPKQAMGLAFSVPRGMQIPPSLRNIYKELQQDLGVVPPSHGDLTTWAEQGVLLLNTVLTTREGEAHAHAGKGWETFTDQAITVLSQHSRHGLIFVLWGGFAQRKVELIDTKKHTILTAAHPSPLSAHRGFIGCRHFSQINLLLRGQGLSEIDWTLPR